MTERSMPYSLILFAVGIGVVCAAACRDGIAEDDPAQAVADTQLTTTGDLLRGYSDRELQQIRQAIPRKPEPPLGVARPRIANVSGTVFDDRNTNGQQDSGEPGLAGVLVTNGEQVARTGKDGRYSFSVRMDENPHHRFVIVTRPNGFAPTRGFFARIRFDEPQTQYDADFGFVSDKDSASRNFWFITASDSQFTTHEQMLPIAKDYAQVTSAPGKPAFLATAGDLTMSGTQFEWDMYDHIRRSSKIPVYEGFGGHDGNCLDPRCTVSFEQRIGPPYYSWNYGGVHFIQIVTETSYLRSAAQERQSDWLRADLQALPPGTPVIAISHYPLPASWFDQRLKDGINVIGQIGAHWHVVQAGSRRGIPVLNSAPARGHDWGAYSRTYRWVHVTPEGIRSQLRVAGQYKRLQVVSPGRTAPIGRQPLVVLAYDTALVVESVACRWISPANAVHQAKLTQRGDWSWHGTFAPDTPGRWRCELQATDVTGAIWTRSHTVDVEPIRPAAGRVGDDFPWVLSGVPPRRIASGPQPPLTPLWVTHTQSVHVLHSSPVVADGRVFVAVGNPNAGAQSGILCLEATTGKPLWRADSPLGDIRGSVSVHGKTVYAVTGGGWIAAYDTVTGDNVWNRPLQDDYRHGRPLAINNTPPVPTRFGLLVSDWQKPQRLLDYATGESLATLAGDVGSYSAFATVFDDVMYCVRRGGGVALHLPDGKVKWKIEETSRSTSAPIVVGGKLIYNGSSGVKVRDAASGKLIWQAGVANAGYQNAIPIVWDQQLLVNGTDFRALDLQSGQSRWTIDCASEADRFVRSRRQSMAGSSTPLICGNYAYFGHDDTSIRAATRDGKVVWEHRLGTPIKTAPTASGNLLLVHDYAGNLWCFAGASGK